MKEIGRVRHRRINIEEATGTISSLRPKTAQSDRKNLQGEDREFHLSEVLHQLGCCRNLVRG